MSVEYAIRPLTTGDEPLLWEMLYQGIQSSNPDSITPRDVVRQPEFARYVEGWGRAGDVGFVAHDRQTANPFGAVWFRLPPVQTGQSEKEIVPQLAFAVKPSYRRMGIGAALHTQLVKANPHHSAVKIGASANNPAVRLYERFGFKVVEEGPNSVTMRREI